MARPSAWCRAPFTKHDTYLFCQSTHPEHDCSERFPREPAPLFEKRYRGQVDEQVDKYIFVLLDLDLPRKDGREVLSAMKADPKLRRLPGIIFSSSEAEQDLLHAYPLQASCFVTRAVDREAFLSSVKASADLWLASAKLPPRAWG